MPFGEVAPHALLVRMRLWSVRSHSKAHGGHVKRGTTACHHLSHSEMHPLHVSEHSVSCSTPSGAQVCITPPSHRWAMMDCGGWESQPFFQKILSNSLKFGFKLKILNFRLLGCHQHHLKIDKGLPSSFYTHTLKFQSLGTELFFFMLLKKVFLGTFTIGLTT